MYILNWNPDERLIQVDFGGAITRAEAEVFLDDLRDLLKVETIDQFEMVLDFAKVSRMDNEVMPVFEFSREVAQFSGASLVTFVTRSDDEVANMTNRRLQQVLEGAEKYVAYSLAA